MQEFEFVDNRRVLWVLGILALAVGLLAAFLIVPRVGRAPDIGGPDIQLPKIGTLPPQDAPKMPVRFNSDREAHH